MVDRTPCINPRCGRTFKHLPGEPEGYEVICSKCFKTVPHLRRRYRQLRSRLNRVHRLLQKRGSIDRIAQLVKIEGTISNQADKNWGEIRRAFLSPGKPEGLAVFLEEWFR